MNLTADDLGAFGDLAKSIGLLGDDGRPNSAWFSDPVGSDSGNQHGLRTIVSDDAQRDALLGFVDSVLGDPDRTQHGDAVWVPLFQETSPNITIFAVIDARPTMVYVGVGATIRGDGPPSVTGRIHVPIARFARGTASIPSDDDGLPAWSLLGRRDGRIEITVGVELRDNPPPPTQAALGALTVTLGVPTSSSDSLHVALELVDLQLPGSSTPQTFRLDASNLETLSADVFRVVVGLLRAQADALDPTDPATKPFAAIAGLLGLRHVIDIPALDLERVLTDGVAVIVEWLEKVLGDNASRDAWLGQLAALTGTSVDAPNDAVTITVGPLSVGVGVLVAAGVGGQLALTPWIDVALGTRTGARVHVRADLLRADTATGAVTAVPTLRAEAVFGVGAGGAALLLGDPGVETVTVGFVLDANRRPHLELRLLNAVVAGQTHERLDLSSPAAAVDAAQAVLDAALHSALAVLGDPARTALRRVLGLTPPAVAGSVVTATAVTDLVSNPVGAIAAYWERLRAAPAAMAAVLGSVQRLLTGSADAPVPGLGTSASKWTVQLVDSVELTVHDEAGELVVELATSVERPVFTDSIVVLRAAVCAARIELATKRIRFVSNVDAHLTVRRADSTPSTLLFGNTIVEFESLGLHAKWQVGSGLRGEVVHDGLQLIVGEQAGSSRISLPVPELDEDGKFHFAPDDWDDVEHGLAALLGGLHLSLVDATLQLIGWTGSGPRLALKGLVGPAPETAIRIWAGDLALRCEHVRAVLAPISAVLSGFVSTRVFGLGSDRSPYRCPVGGLPGAPGIAVWLDPGCPPPFAEIGNPVRDMLRSTSDDVPPTGNAIASALRSAADVIPDVEDLIFARPSLGTGLDLLVQRWTGTDGLVGAPTTLPVGVGRDVIDDTSYDELLTLGTTGLLLPRVVAGGGPGTINTNAVIHVGCEERITGGRGVGLSFDVSAAGDAASITAAGTVPATGAGAWFVRLPTAHAAGVASPTRGPVGEQAARLAAVLAARVEPIVVVAYGASGAAAIRAANALNVVTHVVTVGTPWSTVSLDTFRTGISGDAFRFLCTLTGEVPPARGGAAAALQMSPFDIIRSLRSRAERAASEDTADAWPSADSEVRRAGLDVTAVFGALGADLLATGLAAAAADGLVRRTDSAPEAPHTALHVGVQVPVLDIELGGVLVGIGATIELATLRRSGAAVPIEIGTERRLILDVRLAVLDGWLVGGPGAGPADADVRWMSARVALPLGDADPTYDGDVEFVLHEARAFEIERERWVVRADGDAVTATTLQPEVKVLLAGVMSRLGAAAPDVARLLDAIGLARSGGFDPDALDRLFHDPVPTLRGATWDRADVAATLRRLIPGATGALTTVTWPAGPATITLDVNSGVFDATAALAAAPADGLPAVTAGLHMAGGGGGADVSFVVGAMDPDSGGMRLIGSVTGLGSAAAAAAASASTASSLVLEWGAPGSATPRRVPLFPAPSAEDFVDLASVLGPAAIVHGLVGHARRSVSAATVDALDTALDALGLLASTGVDGTRRVIFPVGLVQDPAAWLRRGVASWRSDLPGTLVSLLESAASLVAPGRGADPGWPLFDGVRVTYGPDGDRAFVGLDVALDATLVGSVLHTELFLGLSIGTTGTATLRGSAGVSVEGRGLQLLLGPDVQLALLRPSPTPPLPIYPTGPGLGTLLGAAAVSALPPLLNALANHRSDGGASLVKHVGAAVFAVGDAMALLDADQFTGERLTLFAADPIAATLARLPALGVAALAAVATALDPASTLVHVVGPTSGRTTLEFGAGRKMSVTIDTATAQAAIEVRADLAVDGVGHVVIEPLRLTADGLSLSARLGPADFATNGGTLRPLIVVRAGTQGAAAGGRCVGIGLALDDLGVDSVEVRWSLDATAPSLAAVHRGASGETVSTDALAVAASLLGIVAGLASGLALAKLDPTLSDTARDYLRGVVLIDADPPNSVDPTLFTDLFDPDALLARVQRLAWNCAAPSAPLAVTFGGTLTVSLVRQDLGGGRRRVGVALSLPANTRFELASGDPSVAIEIEPSWIEPAGPPGVSIFLFEGNVGGVPAFELTPAIEVAGVGLRFTKASGPLLDLGAATIDAIAVHLYGEALIGGAGYGMHVELGGLAISPGGAGGSNAVANSIMNDAGATGAANRPSFSPSLAVQRHPGESDFGVSIRAEKPPGPWWLVVQRQLGPLSIERIGFDSAETNRRVSRISLLFDGGLSLFGLTAKVDQLSVSWLGGDLLDASNWAVDLQGLAIAADLSGISLAGGLLKTNIDGSVGYVGMLLGRFGVYGLTVFGGYSKQGDTASFFVFGAVNGPFGGPPAFFVTGLGGGLGINRGLRYPDDLSKFNEYPFIQALDPAAAAPDPMQKLRELTTYFPPQNGNLWFAAGISFTSFALVDGIAVIAVSFGDGLEVSLLGLARMALPRPQAALVSIELGLLARFSTREGLFSIRAQLTENSWLLYPEVRLTGGFAFVVWWKGPNRGQFVLTLGGYHPSFRREGYPEVPRLGLVWRVNDDIVVKGGSYFALTSEALMAGVDVEASADFGWAWARVAFGAHGIVYFDPFWFEVSAYARISAGVKIKTWLGTVSFSASMGADIVVSGPDFHGKARFGVGPVSLTVGFGSDRKVEPRVLDWIELTEKYLENAGGSARALSAITGAGTLASATSGARSVPTADGTALRPFEVSAEFEITFTSTVPVAHIDLALPTGAVAVAVTDSSGRAAVLGIKPMRAAALHSTLRLNVSKIVANAATPMPEALVLLAANRETLTEAFPIGVWGAPDTPGLAQPPLPKGEVLFAGSGLRLRAVAAKLDRGPTVDYYRVKAGRRPLPLQATGTERAVLLTLADTFAIPMPASASEAIDVARGRLFVDAAEPGDGLLDRGRRSRSANAAFVGDRAAPPLFGLLSDGLAPANTEGAVAERRTPAEPSALAELRPPTVRALLMSGTGVQVRPVPTTVADADIKRRPAPTLAAANARLSSRLPVRLLRTTTTAAGAGDTVVASGRVPHTTAPGTDRVYAAGTTAGIRGLDVLVAGLGARSSGAIPSGADPALPSLLSRPADPDVPFQMLTAGDVVVLTLPDAAIDADIANRPSLEVDGSARVVMVRGDGRVLHDTTVIDGRVAVPPATALIAAHWGSSVVDAEGLVGWHARARVARLGTQVALGAGCVIATESVVGEVALGWSLAAEAVRDAAAVSTRFVGMVRTVVIVLELVDPARLASARFDSIGLDLLGTHRAVDADGTSRPPTVILSGTRTVLVYELVPAESVVVRIRDGGDWDLAGVLAGDEEAEAVTGRIAARGIEAVAARILAGGSPPGTLRWIPSEGAPQQ